MGADRRVGRRFVLPRGKVKRCKRVYGWVCSYQAPGDECDTCLKLQERVIGFEPTTCSLEATTLPTELHPLVAIVDRRLPDRPGPPNYVTMSVELHAGSIQWLSKQSIRKETRTWRHRVRRSLTTSYRSTDESGQGSFGNGLVVAATEYLSIRNGTASLKVDNVKLVEGPDHHFESAVLERRCPLSKTKSSRQQAPPPTFSPKTRSNESRENGRQVFS